MPRVCVLGGVHQTGFPLRDTTQGVSVQNCFEDLFLISLGLYLKNVYPVFITLKLKLLLFYRQLKGVDMAPLLNNFRPLQPVNNRKVSSEAIVLVPAES